MVAVILLFNMLIQTVKLLLCMSVRLRVKMLNMDTNSIRARMPIPKLLEDSQFLKHSSPFNYLDFPEFVTSKLQVGPIRLSM